MQIQQDDEAWESKTLQGGRIIIGRSDFSSRPSFLSRQHLELWYEKGIAYAKPLGQNKSFLRRNEADSICPEIEVLTKGVVTAVPLGAVLLLEKSHKFNAARGPSSRCRLGCLGCLGRCGIPSVRAF